MEKAVLNVDTLYISQNMNGSYSHNGDLGIDISRLKYLKAPFTGKIKRKYSNCNGIWLESVNKVEYADGTIDYMTVMTLHDNDISDLYVNKKIKQNEVYYQPGIKGNVTGSHIHIAVGKGRFKGNGWYKGKYQPKVKSYAWFINNQYDINKALFLHSDVKISKNSYKWKIIEKDDKKIESNRKKYYKVKKGDTLSSIALKYKMYWKDLYEDNKDIIGDNPNLIKPGQKLVIEKTNK